MGSLYRSQHELIFVFKHGKGSHRNNVQLGKYGRNRTNVWQYPGINTFRRNSEEGDLLVLHPTVKPVALIADAILDCSARGDIVLDGFLGSGSTLIAAERVGRICFGLEIDPGYVDTAVRRWQRYTGEQARLPLLRQPSLVPGKIAKQDTQREAARFGNRSRRIDGTGCLYPRSRSLDGGVCPGRTTRNPDPDIGNSRQAKHRDHGSGPKPVHVGDPQGHLGTRGAVPHRGPQRPL